MRCETLEDEAMGFLGELAQRYIIQVTERNPLDQIEYIRLHDLMREFCIKKASESQFLENVTSTCSSNSRRISILAREYYFEENHYVRTIYFRGEGEIMGLDSIHKQFKLLRVLSVSNSSIDLLPEEIGNLIHLTYLSLVHTDIMKPPESIRKLRNLMYFVYRSYDGEVEVPNDLVGNMKNLRVLELPWRLKLRSNKRNNSLGICSERHKKLHTLKCGAGRWMTKDLLTIDLPTLRDLCFYEVEETEELEAIYGCLSLLKASLHKFECRFRAELQFDVQKLRDCESLSTLTLEGPILVNDTSIQFPPNLVSLHLAASKIKEGVDLMEVVGHLPKLKYLFLNYHSYMGTHLSCTGTAFPQLQELTLWGLDNLEEWRVEGRAMDRLNKILINGCKRLKRLPEKWLAIHHMPIEFCRRLD